MTLRFRTTPLFLPRTLRRSHPRPSPAVIRAAPTVRYVASDERFDWIKNVPRLRCLWCARRFYRFADKNELLLHLRTCHARFKYELGDSDSQDAREITVYVRRAQEHQLLFEVVTGLASECTVLHSVSRCIPRVACHSSDRSILSFFVPR